MAPLSLQRTWHLSSIHSYMLASLNTVTSKAWGWESTHLVCSSVADTMIQRLRAWISHQSCWSACRSKMARCTVNAPVQAVTQQTRLHAIYWHMINCMWPLWYRNMTNKQCNDALVWSYTRSRWCVDQQQKVSPRQVSFWMHPWSLGRWKLLFLIESGCWYIYIDRVSARLSRVPQFLNRQFNSTQRNVTS